MSDTRFWVSSTPSVIGPIGVTPEVAAEMLESNGANRNKRDGNIDRYARDMESGHWRLTGQGIQFSKSGRLLDGQNRLMACVKAGVPFQTFVTVGLDDDAMISIDRGAPRSFADDLTILGYSRANRLAAAVSAIYRYMLTDDVAFLASQTNRMSMSSDEGFEVLRGHPGIESTMDELGCRDRLRKVAPMSVIDSFAYVVGRVHHDDMVYFFDRIGNPVGLKEGSPILALISASESDSIKRKRLGVRGGLNSRYKVALLTKAWNAYMEGRSVSKLSYRAGGARPEDFPQLGDEYKL